MKKFITLTTYRENREIAIPVEDIKEIEEKRDGNQIYTQVNYGANGWVKAKESVQEVVEKIHALNDEVNECTKQNTNNVYMNITKQ